MFQTRPDVTYVDLTLLNLYFGLDSYQFDLYWLNLTWSHLNVTWLFLYGLVLTWCDLYQLEFYWHNLTCIDVTHMSRPADHVSCLLRRGRVRRPGRVRNSAVWEYKRQLQLPVRHWLSVRQRHQDLCGWVHGVNIHVYFYVSFKKEQLVSQWEWVRPCSGFSQGTQKCYDTWMWISRLKVTVHCCPVFT